jgi:hypothetical protein
VVVNLFVRDDASSWIFWLCSTILTLGSSQPTPTSKMARDVDYSVYLVTGRELLPPGIDYYESLEASLKGGKVTMVQLREKKVETSEFLEIAEKSLAICDKVSRWQDEIIP